MLFTNGSKVMSFRGRNPPHLQFFSKSATPRLILHTPLVTIRNLGKVESRFPTVLRFVLNEAISLAPYEVFMRNKRIVPIIASH